jgi:hypothetical protein
MSEEELLKLVEDKNNNLIICQLLSITSPTPQTPQPTQLEDVETIILYDPGKTIRFTLDIRACKIKAEQTGRRKKQGGIIPQCENEQRSSSSAIEKSRRWSENGKEKSNEYKRQQL